MGHDIQEVFEEALGQPVDMLAGARADTVCIPLAPSDADMLRAERRGEVGVRIGYLVMDNSYGADYWDMHGDGTLVIFISEYERDTLVDDRRDAGRECFVVDRYSHGGDQFSLEGSKWHPHWEDVVPSAVYTPDEHAQEEFRARSVSEGEDVARRWLRDVAVRQLNAYNQWLAGDIYGLVVEDWERQPDGAIERVADDSCWQIIGREHAQATLRERMAEPMAEPSADEAPHP